MPARHRIVVVSPHLDDVVLSAAAQLGRPDLTVVTACTGAPSPDAPLGILGPANGRDERGGTRPRAVRRGRRGPGGIWTSGAVVAARFLRRPAPRGRRDHEPRRLGARPAIGAGGGSGGMGAGRDRLPPGPSRRPRCGARRGRRRRRRAPLRGRALQPALRLAALGHWAARGIAVPRRRVLAGRGARRHRAGPGDHDPHGASCSTPSNSDERWQPWRATRPRSLRSTSAVRWHPAIRPCRLRGLVEPVTERAS